VATTRLAALRRCWCSPGDSLCPPAILTCGFVHEKVAPYEHLGPRGLPVAEPPVQCAFCLIGQGHLRRSASPGTPNRCASMTELAASFCAPTTRRSGAGWPRYMSVVSRQAAHGRARGTAAGLLLFPPRHAEPLGKRPVAGRVLAARSGGSTLMLMPASSHRRVTTSAPRPATEANSPPGTGCAHGKRATPTGGRWS
jgi:hypothetical protein